MFSQTLFFKLQPFLCEKYACSKEDFFSLGQSGNGQSKNSFKMSKFSSIETGFESYIKFK